MFNNKLFVYRSYPQKRFGIKYPIRDDMALNKKQTKRQKL